MGWDEAVRLAVILRADPSTMLAASIEGWKHPISHEALVLADIFDLEHSVNSKKKPKPHWVRPWDQNTSKTRYGNAGGRSSAEVRSILSRSRAGLAPV